MKISRIRREKEEYVRRSVKDIVRKRKDLSNNLVHLTRDYKGFNAIENLKSIISSETIEARNPDCLWKNEIPDELKSYFNVLSLTETPLTQIYNLVTIEFRRRIMLQPYGIIFLKEDLINVGASPVLYLYQDIQLQLFRKLFEENINTQLDTNFLNVFNFVKRIHEQEDFHWEREWKRIGSLNFSEIKYDVLVKNEVEAISLYEELFLDKKKNVNFYLLDENEWLYFYHFEEWPLIETKEGIEVEDGFEAFKVFDEGGEYPILKIIERKQTNVKVVPRNYFY